MFCCCCSGFWLLALLSQQIDPGKYARASVTCWFLHMLLDFYLMSLDRKVILAALSRIDTRIGLLLSEGGPDVQHDVRVAEAEKEELKRDLNKLSLRALNTALDCFCAFNWTREKPITLYSPLVVPGVNMLSSLLNFGRSWHYD